MKMNTLEKLAMNNPLRAMIQRRFEAPLLQQLGGDLHDLDVLEIGCGRGVGTELLLEAFGARRVVAIDLDESMLVRARRRLARFGDARVQLEVGDASALRFADHSFDAVVDFAALHHVEDWQQAVGEVRRVLRPQGRFLFQEVTARWISRWPYRSLFLHPQQNRFSGDEFVAELTRQGITVGENWVERAKGDFIFGAGAREVA